MTIESYLPVFPGFYGTHFESDQAEEMALDHEEDLSIDYNDIEFDYKEYRDRVSERCTSSVWNEFRNSGFGIDIKFDNVYSPREYNFGNDVINCTYTISDADFKDLIEYTKENETEFKTFLEENYSSFDGFISFFETEPKTWYNEYLNEDSTKFERAFVGLLEFWLENESYTIDTMYDDAMDETNYIEYKLLTEQ